MKTARLIDTSMSGVRTPTNEVALICTREQAKIIYEALDLYCSAPDSKNKKAAAEIYHTLGWNYEYLGDR